MARTARYTLTTTPQQVDVARDDRRPGRSVLIVPQAAGTVVICDGEDTDPTTEGCRIQLDAYQAVSFDDVTDLPDDEVWLAVESGTLDIDVAETGVA